MQGRLPAVRPEHEVILIHLCLEARMGLRIADEPGGYLELSSIVDFQYRFHSLRSKSIIA